MLKSFCVARLGSNLEIRFLPDGKAVGQVSLAVKLGIKGKDGEYKTQWINASLFGKRAESLAPYLVKGSPHAFHLRDLHIDEYTDKDGAVRSSLKATIDDVELCGKSQGDEPSRRSEPSPAVSSGAFDMEDNIPFAQHGKAGAGVRCKGE